MLRKDPMVAQRSVDHSLRTAALDIPVSSIAHMLCADRDDCYREMKDLFTNLAALPLARTFQFSVQSNMAVCWLPLQPTFTLGCTFTICLTEPKCVTDYTKRVYCVQIVNNRLKEPRLHDELTPTPRLREADQGGWVSSEHVPFVLLKEYQKAAYPWIYTPRSRTYWLKHWKKRLISRSPGFSVHALFISGCYLLSAS